MYFGSLAWFSARPMNSTSFSASALFGVPFMMTQLSIVYGVSFQTILKFFLSLSLAAVMRPL